MEKILDLQIAYPDFQLNQVIDPEQTDMNNSQIVTKINTIINAINQFLEKGADLITITPLPDFPTAKTINEALMQISGKLTTLDTEARESITELINQMGTVETTVSTQNTKIKKLEDNVASFDSRISGNTIEINKVKEANTTQDGKLASLEANDLILGNKSEKNKTDIQTNTTEIQKVNKRVDDMVNGGDTNTEVILARTSDSGKTFENIGKRMDYNEIKVGKTLTTKGHINFNITEEDTLTGWENDVKVGDLKEHKEEQNPHDIAFANHELDELSHPDVRDSLELINTSLGTKAPQASVTAIEGQITGLNTSVSGLDTRLTTAEPKITTLQTEVASLKSSVSSGKTKVATAITGKGVTTSATATFDTMASNIGKIASGGARLYPYSEHTLNTTTNTLNGTAPYGGILFITSSRSFDASLKITIDTQTPLTIDLNASVVHGTRPPFVVNHLKVGDYVLEKMQRFTIIEFTSSFKIESDTVNVIVYRYTNKSNNTTTLMNKTFGGVTGNYYDVFKRTTGKGIFRLVSIPNSTGDFKVIIDGTEYNWTGLPVPPSTNAIGQTTNHILDLINGIYYNSSLVVQANVTKGTAYYQHTTL